MRSKTSFFNKTLFFKNVTRFAPIWGGYLLCLLLGLMMITDSGATYYRASNFVDLTSAMSVINLGYGLLTAAVLFGDLYVGRMCNALHALPVTRDAFFGTHVLSGLVFSLVPTTIMALCAIPLLIPTPVQDAWKLSLYWLAAANLEYLFFFALAVLCTMFVGNRVGLVGLYSLLNFGSYILYVFLDNAYVPMLHGVVLPMDWFDALSPVNELMQGRFFHVNSYYVETATDRVRHGTYILQDAGWRYLFILCAVAAVLLALAWVLYRRRKLEAAGDLLAFRCLEPVVLVCAAVTGATLLMGVNITFSGDLHPLIFFFAGLLTGWLVARMLLERSIRVIRKGTLLEAAALVAVLALSLGLTKLDVLGIETWQPRQEKVESIALANGYSGAILLMEDAQDIQTILDLHASSIQERLTKDKVQEETAALREELGEGELAANYFLNYSITYHLSDGRIVGRNYYLRTGTPQAQVLKTYMSTIEGVFPDYRYYGGTDNFTPKNRQELLSYAQTPQRISIGQVNVPQEMLTKELVKDLFNAIADDCEAGTMAQHSAFHPTVKLTGTQGEEEMDQRVYNGISYDISVRLNDDISFYISAYADSANVLAWAEDLGITREKMHDAIFGSEDYTVEVIPAIGG